MYIELAVKYWKYHKKRAVFIILSICFSVAALVSAALLVRSNKLQQLESSLVGCGDYDFAFYNVEEAAEAELRADNRFGQFGSVYRCGYAKGQAGAEFEMGYIEDGTAEEMFHLTPVTGRYPQKSGEICIDKLTLNSMGYAARTGQEIELTCMDWNQNELQTVSFMLTGIVEQRIEDTDGGYIRRECQMDTESSSVVVDAPFAYVSKEDADAVYGNGFQKILLANVEVTDTFDDQDMRISLYDKYYVDGEWTGGFLLDTRPNNRSWMANLLLGFRNSDTFFSSWGYNAAQERIGSDSTQKDFYSGVLIPVFFVLIVLITFISLYSAVNMTFSDRIRQNGMFRCLGMSIRSCQFHLALEAGILLVPGILGGYGLGYLIYAVVQKVQKHLFGIYVVGVGDVSGYFRPYLEAATFNPNTFPLLAICIALIPAVVLPAVRGGRVSPVAACAVRNRLHKKQRRFSVLLYMNILTVMIAAVFGYSYFRADNASKNRIYQSQLQSSGLAGWDYYMDQNKIFTYKGAGDELRHDTGISQEALDQIRNSAAVDMTEATMINMSTKLVIEDTEDNQDVMDLLAGTDIMDVSRVADTEELEKVYEIRVSRDKEHRGYQENEIDYQIPSVGIEDGTWKKLQQYIVEGSINLDRIKEGTEVVLVVQDAESCPYQAGDELHLADDVYPDILDSSEKFQQGGKVDFWKPTYEAEGDNWYQYCCSERIRMDVTVGAVMVIGDELDFRHYCYTNSGIFPWNLFVSAETFQSWNLPDKNYSRLWVKCKEGVDTAELESLWYQAITRGQVMQSYIAQDIRDRIDETNRIGMSLFFAMLLMIIVVTLVGVVNSFSMGISMERKRLNMFRAMGGAKRWLVKKRCLLNLWVILAGGVLSVVPVYVFDRVSSLAIRFVEEAWQGGEPLPDNHWAQLMAGYQLMQYQPEVFAATVTAAALLFTTILVGMCMKKELDNSIVDGIRESE